ncbi:NmrA-like family protein [Pseudovirgaria hyperparasitica]|uniref:NmrA-like family protein n=1 Tax=Pseudovirgaria hyperparasitica TaxID=470096 RepID=A0A6A6W8B5_9PEZI|nr:NmrA-like family protein [Pseudovirgaria hyperparasitica]KAF2759092.1 NmrA-like family protein [Pseudovirgaria hyperparasitica]
MSRRNIAIIGANGHLGPSILNALLAEPNFKTTVISRKSSKSTYPNGANVLSVSDDLPMGELIDALHGHDALLCTFGGTLVEMQIKLADACIAAGVRTFIPADFGSCDSSSPRALELVPLYVGKTKVRDYLRSQEDKLSWTSLVCGHFFDYGLKSGLLHVDLSKREAMIFDGGDIRGSASTLARVAEATVQVLHQEAATKNRMLYVQSFCVSQNEVLKATEKVVDAKFDVKNIDSDTYIKHLQHILEENPNDGEAIENMVGVVGIIDANWEEKQDFAMDLLGLKDENLEDVVKRTLHV